MPRLKAASGRKTAPESLRDALRTTGRPYGLSAATWLWCGTVALAHWRPDFDDVPEKEASSPGHRRTDGGTEARSSCGVVWRDTLLTKSS